MNHIIKTLPSSSPNYLCETLNSVTTTMSERIDIVVDGYSSKMCSKIHEMMMYALYHRNAPISTDSLDKFFLHIVTQWPTNRATRNSKFRVHILSNSVICVKCEDETTDKDGYCVWYLFDHDIDDNHGAIFLAPARTPVTPFDPAEHFETICSRFHYAGQKKEFHMLKPKMSAQMCSKCYLRLVTN